LGDNARQHVPMTADDQTTPASHAAPALHRIPTRLGQLVRVERWRIARPYVRRRRREAELAASLARLEADFKHARERHDERLERLELLARELVLTAESLRRATSTRRDRGAG